MIQERSASPNATAVQRSIGSGQMLDPASQAEPDHQSATAKSAANTAPVRRSQPVCLMATPNQVSRINTEGSPKGPERNPIKSAVYVGDMIYGAPRNVVEHPFWHGSFGEPSAMHLINVRLHSWQAEPMGPPQED